ncbi:hypothetical protein KH5_15870 [Urechidicola sp. KH5]
MNINLTNLIMNFKQALKLSSVLFAFAAFMLQGCDDDSSFGSDLEVRIIPTDLSYPEIVNAREFSHIESGRPTINSNGHPVQFAVESIRKGDQILDASFLNFVTIQNPEELETTHPDTGEVVTTYDLSDAGKIMISENDVFDYGDYYFSIKAYASVDGVTRDVIFEDAWHLMIGPGLPEGIAYCPTKANFISGGSETSPPAEVIGGNPDIRFELGSDNEKLIIDASTGVLSLNPSYIVGATESISPTINVVSNITEEVVPFDGVFTAIISQTPEVIPSEDIYFFYPSLVPNINNNLAAGGDGYSRDVPVNPFAGWVFNNNLLRGVNPAPTPDAVAARTAAGISGNKALTNRFWGPLTDPFEIWMITDPVNLTQYGGCFNTKVVFWVKQNITMHLDIMPDGSTPIGFEIQVTDNYTGDVETTSWTNVNDQVSCEINNSGTILSGTPYPLSGLPDADPANNAMNQWVRCELDLADYATSGNFTIAFRNLSYYSSVPSNMRGDSFISDLHFVASEN